jgi:hypothetical protein
MGEEGGGERESKREREEKERGMKEREDGEDKEERKRTSHGGISGLTR